jgi:MFS family permease
MDSAGALLGPALAVGAMLWLANDIRSVLWVGVLPAMIAVALLVAGVREPDKVGSGSAKRIHWTDLKGLSAAYWTLVALGAIFTLARFSEAFLILRGEQTGLAMAYLPLVFIVMNSVYTAGAYPAGVLSDRMSHAHLLLTGAAVLVGSQLVLAVAGGPSAVFTGAALWGLHLALTQGLFSKLVADFAPPAFRGTAFGVFNLVSGVALLFGSVIAGALWSSIGPSATFYAGAAFAAVTAVGMAFARR